MKLLMFTNFDFIGSCFMLFLASIINILAYSFDMYFVHIFFINKLSVLV